MLVSFIPALLETKKLWKEIKEEKGFKKSKHWSALICCWLLPPIVFFSTKATDWASDKTLNEVRVESSNDLALANNDILGLSNQVHEATNKLAKIEEATKQKPLKERLKTCLDSIDDRIIPALQNGRTHFEGMLPTNKFIELENLASESEAKAYISFHPAWVNPGRSDSFKISKDFWAAGTLEGASFDLNSSLLN